MDLVIRRWLSKTPELLTAYLVWRNRTREHHGIELFATLAFFVAWVAAASLYVHADRAAAASTLAWLHRHDLSWSTIAAIVSAVLVSRRRALTRSKVPRVWTAALPTERSAARWQAIASDSLPAILLTCILAATFGGMSLAVLFGDDTSAPIITWAATTGGVVLGAGLSYLVRPARQEDIYEGSRYVPHRRRAETPIPTGSLAALGSWPVRQSFASARPKTLARVMVPIMLAVPLGSQAADVMVTIGLLTAVGAVVTLVAAVISVSARASRWLMPLPLDPPRLARSTLGPALASMLIATSIESWLIWVLRSSIRESIADGVLTLAASVILAVFGCLLAIRANSKGAHGRP
jgi:hypothetical protein